MKRDKYAHVTDEALKARLVKLDEGQGWSETDPLYKRLREVHQKVLKQNEHIVSRDVVYGMRLSNPVGVMRARKEQQMRLRRELTTSLKRIAKHGYRTGYAHELIDDLEKLQGKFKEWQKEVEELLNE